MAKFSYQPTMRDSQEESTNNSSNMLDEWARSPDRKGWVSGTNPKHLQQIEFITNAIQTGQISEEGVRNLATRVKGLAPYIASAMESRKAMQGQQNLISQYVNPGSPAVPAKPFETDEEQQFGLSPLRGNISQEAKPEVPAVRNYQGAVDALASRGYVDLADKYKKLGGLDQPADRNMAIRLAIRAAGIDPNKSMESLTPQEAQKVYQFYSPPVTAAVPGGTIVAPRGQVGGFVANPTPVPPKVVEDISSASSKLENMRNLASKFKDEYGGYGSDTVGSAAIEYKKRFGKDSDTEMVDWWQTYQDHVNEVRKDLFGSALTEPERKEFYKAMATPGMKPTQIKTNLTRQEAISKRAASKLARSAAANTGYNQQQIKEAAGNVAGELLQGEQPKRQASTETKVIGGKTYIRKDGKWFEQ